MHRCTISAMRCRALALATAASFVIPVAALAAPPPQDLRSSAGVLMQVSALQQNETYSRFIVKYRDTAVPSAGATRLAELGNRLDAVANAAGLNLGHVRQLATGADLVAVSGKPLDAAAAQALMLQFGKDPNVEYVEPDARMRALLTPNDTRYTEQWHYQDSTAGMRLPAAWDIATGTGVVVAVIDTGITPHSDLSANIVAGYDFISDAAAARDGNGRDANANDEGDWYTNDECGAGSGSSNSSWHGTHVAGTIAAVTSNGSGVAGVAFGARVQPVRVLGKCGGSVSDIADAIIWSSGGTVSGASANPTPAKVINMSLGGGGACSSTFQNAINSAVGRGTVVIVAAGNENQNASNANPANCANVVTVAALDRNGSRSYYSNYGTVVDVAAPGGDVRSASSNGILSTLNAGTTTQGAASCAWYQGTSMATPHVAGLAALILSKGSKTPAEVESLLKANTRALPGTCTGGCGTGLVDALKTMQAVTGGGGGGGNVLANGVPVTGLGAATGTALYYTIVVPAGASNLNIATSGGSGDADLYVRFGSQPTTSTYDCRPYKAGNAETCTFAAPQAGTYHVMLRAYSTYSGVTLTGSYATGGGGGGTSFFQNLTDFAINDNSTIESPIAVSGRSGNAPATLAVAVTITHTYKGDLKVDLVAPDGSVYVLHNRTGGSADNIIQTFTVNASSEPANGTWKLRVNDNASGDTGVLDKWSLQF